MSETPDVRLGAWAPVRLVAGRELSVRLKSKAFLITTAATLILLVGFILVIKLIGDDSDATVGFSGPSAALQAPLQASAEAIGDSIDTRVVPDEATGRAQLDDGTLDALVVGTDPAIQVVVKKDLDEHLRNAFTVLARQLALSQHISQLGGDPAQVNEAIAAASVQVESIEPPYPYQPQQLALGVIAGILIYMSLMINGQSVAQGVVEEKASRVVELLLSTLRPWQLMAGKVLGIGAVGLIQMAVIGVVGVAAGLGTGVLTIPASAAVGVVTWLVVWFVLGFLAYSLMFAALGALVSRQEDVGGVVAPALTFVILGYVLGASILPSDPDNKLVEVFSVVPLFAPTLMPMRLAIGGVPAWEAGLAVLLIVATIPALVWLTARIYRNAVMRSGARVKLTEALRPA